MLRGARSRRLVAGDSPPQLNLRGASPR